VNPFFKNWVIEIGCDESYLFESSSFCSNYNDGFEKEMTFWKNKVGPNLVAKLFQCNAFCSRVVKDALFIQKIFDEIVNKYNLRIAIELFSVNSFITNIDPTKIDQHIFDNQIVVRDKTVQGVALLYELLDVFELFSGIYDQPIALKLFRSGEFVTRCKRETFQNLVRECNLAIGTPFTIRLFSSNVFPAHIFKSEYVNTKAKAILFNYTSEHVIDMYTNSNNYDDGKRELKMFEDEFPEIN
jgi:hypothetical protein